MGKHFRKNGERDTPFRQNFRKNSKKDTPFFQKKAVVLSPHLYMVNTNHYLLQTEKREVLAAHRGKVYVLFSFLWSDVILPVASASQDGSSVDLSVEISNTELLA